MQIPGFHTLLLECKLSEYKNIQNLCIKKTSNNENNEIKINILKRERDYLNDVNTISNKKIKLKTPLQSTKNLFPQFFQNHYEGDTLNGMCHGEGKLIFKNGDIYKEISKDHKLKGGRTIKRKSGNVYKGTFIDNKLNGEGTIEWKNGDVYTGTFKDNELNGEGEQILKSGNVYKGTFKDNKLNGEGMINFCDGAGVFKGTFIDNKLNGEGTINWMGGRVYQGTFKESVIIKGSLTLEDGTIFKGSFTGGQVKGSKTPPGKDPVEGTFDTDLTTILNKDRL